MTENAATGGASFFFNPNVSNGTDHARLKLYSIKSYRRHWSDVGGKGVEKSYPASTVVKLERDTSR